MSQRRGGTELRLTLHDGDAQRRETTLVEDDASLSIRNKNADVIKHGLLEWKWLRWPPWDVALRLAPYDERHNN